MKRVNNTFAIATIVLGLGAATSVNANQFNIENSLKQIVASQSQQVLMNVTKKLNKSVQISLTEVLAVNEQKIKQELSNNFASNQKLATKTDSTAAE